MRQEDTKRAALKLVHKIADYHAMPPPRRVRNYSKLDPDATYRWIRLHAPTPKLHRPLMKFAGWLWQTGTRDNATVLAILADFLARKPSNPYAYYAPNGAARDVRAAQHNARLSVAENEAFKAADRAFLEGR
jgi:hypothetical protein